MDLKIIYKQGIDPESAFDDAFNFTPDANYSARWKKMDKPMGDKLEEFIKNEMEGSTEEHTGGGFYIELGKVKQKRKKLVENTPVLKPRKWKTVYKLINKNNGAVIPVDDELITKGKAVKKAKAISKEYHIPIVVVINKELVEGDYLAATINFNPKPIKGLKDYVFFGFENNNLDLEDVD